MGRGSTTLDDCWVELILKIFRVDQMHPELIKGIVQQKLSGVETVPDRKTGSSWIQSFLEPACRNGGKGARPSQLW
jgi:hypothetical protein